MSDALCLERFLEALRALDGFTVKTDPVMLRDGGISTMIEVTYKGKGVRTGAPHVYGDITNTWNIVGMVSRLILDVERVQKNK